MTRPDPTTKPRQPIGPAALAAFVAQKAEIDEMLARLQALSDDHFGAHPDEIDWGHVGTLNHYRARLREIADMAFGEGDAR